MDIEGTTDSGRRMEHRQDAPLANGCSTPQSVSAAGTYALELRLASASTGGTVRVEVDGVDVTGTLVVPNTGGWQAWRTIRKEGIVLQAGLRRIRLVFVSAGTDGIANMNFFKFVP